MRGDGISVQKLQRYFIPSMSKHGLDKDFFMCVCVSVWVFLWTTLQCSVVREPSRNVKQITKTRIKNLCAKICSD